MALEFGQIEPAQLGQASRFDIPLNEWVGVQFESGQHSQLGPRLISFIGDQVDNSPLLTPEEATKQFGITGHLAFLEATHAERAREMNERKQAELKYAAYHESALHSWFSPKAALGTLAALVGGSTHPVDLAVNFLPFVGEEAKVSQIAGRVVRTPARWGLVPESFIDKTPLLARFPNYSRAVIDATIGNAALEIPNFYLARRNQEEYDSSDFFTNVLGGGLAGGTLAIGIKKLFHLAHFGYERLHGETRDAMNWDSMAESLSGESRPIAQRAAVDEQAIRDATAPDLIAQARTFGADSVEGGIIRKLVERFDAGERSPALFESLAGLLDKHYDPEGSLKGLRTELYGIVEAISKTEPLLEQASPQVRERIAENIRALELRRNALADDIARHQPQRIQAEMARRVELILKQRRADAQRMVEGKIEQAKAQALDANIARSKSMTNEQVKKFAATMDPADKTKFLDADTTAKTEIATEAMKNLEDHAKRLELEAEMHEEAGDMDTARSKLKSAELLREQLKAELDAVKTMPDKAIDAARPCITGI